MRLRPGVPRSARTVRAAVRLMYAGAAVSTVNLIILLAFIGDIKAYHAMLGHRLTAAQVSQLNTAFITLSIVSDLVPIALWLWMARANGQGRNWARSLSTVLFGLATLDLTGAFGTPVIRVTVVPMLFGPTLPVLTWLAGWPASPRCGCSGARPPPRSSSRRALRGCHQQGQGCQGGLRGCYDHGWHAVHPGHPGHHGPSGTFLASSDICAFLQLAGIFGCMT